MGKIESGSHVRLPLFFYSVEIDDDVEIGDILCTLYLKEGAEPIKQDLTSFYTFEEKR